ncbi:MAG TPA: hypothetical protein VI168_04045 [Croceibacterium sp.]
MKPMALAAALLAAAIATRAPAQDQPGRDLPQALGMDVTLQTDADDTDVVRVGVNLDADYQGPEEYLGLRLERVWFNPLDRGWKDRERVYLRAADSLDGWKWAATIGTDGDTVLGSASVHDEARFRKELFVERDLLETPEGLDRGLYYTFAGAAIDRPANDRNLVTLVAGVQEFTGDNVRLHARANFIHVLDPEQGLSAQVRTRWFRNSVPREADYYSPRWYAQVLPVLQLRRTTDDGWRYLLAGGIGLQRDSDSGWRRSGYLNAQVTTPPVTDGWALTAGALYTDTPTASGLGYRYFQASIGVVRAF